MANCSEPLEKPTEPVTPTFGFKKKVAITSFNTYYKAVYVYDLPIKLHIEAKADSTEYFDFNLIDKDSYNGYVATKDEDVLMYYTKMTDRRSIDTTLHLKKGNYLFAFGNFKNEHAIALQIEVKSVE